MSKYIKLEDAEDKMYQLWEEDTDNKINSVYCFDDYRAIGALRSLPTIEVSEDCISRKWLEEHKEVVSYKNEWYETEIDEFVSWENIENAPSVVPTAEQSSIVHCKDCIWRDKDNQGEYYCTYAKGLADIGEESFCSWGNRIKK